MLKKTSSSVPLIEGNLAEVCLQICVYVCVCVQRCTKPECEAVFSFFTTARRIGVIASILDSRNLVKDL